MKGSERNLPCPCGCGKKLKNCATRKREEMMLAAHEAALEEDWQRKLDVLRKERAERKRLGIPEREPPSIRRSLLPVLLSSLVFDDRFDR